MRTRAVGYPAAVVAAALALAGLPAVSHAEPVGSPSSILKKGKWAMAAAASAFVKRRMNGGADATVVGGGHARGYGLTDWLSIYGKVGGASIKVDDATIHKTTSPTTTNSFGMNFLASVQLKAKLLEHRRWGMEWDGSFQYVDMRAGHRGKNEGRWHEWQFATSVAKSFGRVKPYLGAKISLVNFAFKVREQGNVLTQGIYKQDTPIGAFVGTDVYLGQHEDVILNVESGYLDGPEIAASLAYLF